MSFYLENYKVTVLTVEIGMPALQGHLLGLLAAVGVIRVSLVVMS